MDSWERKKERGWGLTLRNWSGQVWRYKSKICRAGQQAGNAGKSYCPAQKPFAGRVSSCFKGDQPLSYLFLQLTWWASPPPPLPSWTVICFTQSQPTNVKSSETPNVWLTTWALWPSKVRIKHHTYDGSQRSEMQAKAASNSPSLQNSPGCCCLSILSKLLVSSVYISEWKFLENKI